MDPEAAPAPAAARTASATAAGSAAQIADDAAGPDRATAAAMTPARMDELATAGDFAAIAQPSMSPILGRYLERNWVRGEGHFLYDTDGREYLDFACGIATTSLGHHHPAVTAAVHAQVDRLLHTCNALGYIETVSRASTLLAQACPAPLDTVFFCNSGSESIEAALKLARRVTGRPGIVAFRGGFHGRTFGATSVTSSNINYRTGYEPLLPGVYFAPYPNVYHDFGGDEDAATTGTLAELRKLLAHEIPASQVAAFIIEPIQGEGGFNPAPAAYLRELRSICDEHGILLICDEVQSGIGRTGRMWAFEHAGIVPDVICSAKAIANGLPLGAIVARRELHERWGRGAHGSTFGGNPVSAAAAVAVLTTIAEQGLVANAAARGEELAAGLREIATRDTRIGNVRGRGLMAGVEFVKDRATREPDGEACAAVMAAAADHGLLVLSCGTEHNVIRILPPIDVTAAEIAEGLVRFEAALRSVGVAG
jgi:4-aminobutyrate aminotransferase